LVLTGRIKSPWDDSGFYRWQARLKREGLTATLRLQLRELLAPKVKLKRPFRWSEEEESTELTDIKQLVDWDLELASDHAHSALRNLAGEHWTSVLPALLDDVQQLLRDALDLLRELGTADDHNDRSHWDLPSISPHWQNRDFRDWVTLIELLRDAWLATCRSAPERSRRIALGWFDVPYPTFKRLALFAASQGGIDSMQWVEWLVADDAWCLWSAGTQRESMRLLVQQGKKLSPEALGVLETAILYGPPRDMYRDDLDPGHWQALIDHAVWVHFAKLCEGGAQLSEVAESHFATLSAANPDWKLANNDQDEFSQ
jgi:hypothetical protein